jgi:hypothetical protein
MLPPSARVTRVPDNCAEPVCVAANGGPPPAARFTSYCTAPSPSQAQASWLAVPSTTECASSSIVVSPAPAVADRAAW